MYDETNRHAGATGSLQPDYERSPMTSTKMNRTRYEVVLLLIPVLVGCLDILGYKDPALDECAPAGCTGGGGAGQGGTTSTGGTAGTGGSGGVGGGTGGGGASAGGTGGAGGAIIKYCMDDSDCDPTEWCGHAQCGPKQENGAGCAEYGPTSCASGFCTDGVCCESACEEACAACSEEKTGVESGECRSVKNGTDPDGECTSPQVCTQNGCGLALNGTICVAAENCNSGFCRDGVCCDKACDGTCEACSVSNLAPVDGQCGFILSGFDPDNECPGAANCDGSGMCLP